MNDTKLTIVRGDTKTYKLVFRNSSGIPVDITGWTVYFTVKENLSQTDDQALISKNVTSHTDPANGETSIVLSSTDTDHVGNYIYDIQYKNTLDEIHTILEGILSFSKDITRRT